MPKKGEREFYIYTDRDISRLAKVYLNSVRVAKCR